jgi:hypothetical protein
MSEPIQELREDRDRLLAALKMYAENGSEPASSLTANRKCCGEWPECSHALAVVERIPAGR